MKGETKPKTVKVRIAVAVLPDGRHSTAGWLERLGEPPPDDEAIREVALEALGMEVEEFGDNAEALMRGARVHFVEADIPLPEPPESITVEGEVSGA